MQTLRPATHGAPPALGRGVQPAEPSGHLKDGDRGIKPSVEQVAALTEAAPDPDGRTGLEPRWRSRPLRRRSSRRGADAEEVHPGGEVMRQGRRITDTRPQRRTLFGVRPCGLGILALTLTVRSGLGPPRMQVVGCEFFRSDGSLSAFRRQAAAQYLARHPPSADVAMFNEL